MALSDTATKIYVVKTSDLDSEFNIGKNTRVSRLAAIGLTSDKLHKDGKYYWLTDVQYSLFKELDDYILETGSMKGFPYLFNDVVNSSDLIAGADSKLFESEVKEEEAGELATVNNRLEVNQDTSEENYGEFETGSSSYNPHDRLAQIDANAQQTAAGLLLAEAILADRYLQNPDRLPAHLRQQIDAVEYRQIDPKEYAARLIRGIENLVNFGEAA